MQPKTKYQRHLCELSKRLRPLASAQQNYAYNHCLAHQAFVSAKSFACCDCGHMWRDDTKSTRDAVRCPECGRELAIPSDPESLRQRVRKSDGYFTIITVIDGLQVLRHFYVEALYRKGKAATYSFYEIVQHWVDPAGKVTLFSHSKKGFFWYGNGCGYSSTGPMEIRSRFDKLSDDVMPDAVYPRMQVLPLLRRNGFDGEFHDCTPTELFAGILADNYAETLLKARQYSLLRKYLRNNCSFGSPQRSSSVAVKLCLRYGYIVQDACEYFDYISMADTLHLNLHNPSIACPADLSAAHDKAVADLERQRERERRARERQQLEEDKQGAARFYKQKRRYFGIAFGDENKDITVVVLDSIEAYKQEAGKMHHCVFGSKYFAKPESLILSARSTRTGDRIETIELSLKNYTVLQSRGVCNQDTPYHDAIISLVEKNAGLFKKAKKQLPKACVSLCV